MLPGTFKEHLQRATRAPEAIRKADFSVKDEKCRFGHLELKFLARVVGAVIRSDTKKRLQHQKVSDADEQDPSYTFSGAMVLLPTPRYQFQ